VQQAAELHNLLTGLTMLAVAGHWEILARPCYSTTWKLPTTSRSRCVNRREKFPERGRRPGELWGEVDAGCSALL
jgi:hypothetical protein